MKTTAAARLFFREDSISPLYTGQLAVVDVETSGFSFAKGGEIVEIAVLIMEQDGTVVEEYDTLVRARGGAGNPMVHQITDDMLDGAPRFRDIAGDLVRLLQGRVVVAHNASFEDRFLLPEFERAGVHGMHLPALCSLRAARAAMPYLNSHKLGDLVACLGHRMTDAHTARGDVRALAKILPDVLEDYQPLRFGSATVPQVVAANSQTHSRFGSRRPSIPAQRSLRSGDNRVPRDRSLRQPRDRSTPEAPSGESRHNAGFAGDRLDRQSSTVRQPRNRTPRARAEDAETDYSPQWTQRISFL